jgi:Domain of unknown function (DUF4387)
MHIADIAQFVTSKNAGPFLLTVDIVFRDAASYQRFKAQRPLTKAGVAELYGIPPEQVLDIIEFDPAYAIKITMRRPWGSGAIGETDVYGAQQHMPIAAFDIPWETTP